MKQRAKKEEHRKGHTCKKCNAVFQHGSSLIRHKRLHLIEKRHKCHLCGEAFRKREALTSHMACHIPQKKHQCPVCGKTFKSGIKFLKHKLSHGSRKGNATKKSFSKHTVKNLPSPRNGQTTSSLSMEVKPDEKVGRNAIAHPSLSGELQLYSCDVCHKVFDTPARMWKHKKRHQHCNFLCRPCGKGFERIADLDEHFRSEHGSKGVKLGAKRSSELKCCICSTPFLELQSLIVHMTTHLEPASLR